jgi:tetratricopeptide (TPR) repeat protein
MNSSAAKSGGVFLKGPTQNSVGAEIMLKKYVFSFVVVCIIFTSSILAQDIQTENFAKFLSDNGEYYRAITEYYKLLYNTSDQQKKSQILKSIGVCYYDGDDYDGMITFFNKNKNLFIADSSLYIEMKLLYAKSNFQLGSYVDAVSNLEKVDTSRNDSLSDEIKYYLGLSYAHLGDWDNSYKYIYSIKKEPKYLNFREYMLNQKETISSFSKKDPTLAGIFSAVVPGTGYIYCNRVTTGITSFVVNGLLCWSIYDAIKNKQYGLSVSIGFFGMGWYVGNILGSVSAANQYNANVEENILKNATVK